MPRQSTLRSSAITPTPSPLSHPDLLLRILSHADNPTLATCLRVSKAWYDLAGPILYRVIECRNLDAVEEVWRGSEIVDKAITTRSGPRQTNLKRGLLRHTRYLYTAIETGFPTSEALYRLAELSRQLTLRVDFRRDCAGTLCSNTEQSSDTPRDHLATHTTTLEKVILRGLTKTCLRHAAHVLSLIPRSHLVSTVIQPDLLACLNMISVGPLTRSQSPPSRHQLFLDSGTRSHPSLRIHSLGWALEICALIDFYCATRIGTGTVGVYFMDDVHMGTEGNKIWSPLECKSLVQAEFPIYSSGRKYLDAVTLKTRADYLDEAVKDEYSEEDLEFFREAEQRAQDREKEREREREKEKEKEREDEERAGDTDIGAESEPPEE